MRAYHPRRARPRVRRWRFPRALAPLLRRLGLVVLFALLGLRRTGDPHLLAARGSAARLRVRLLLVAAGVVELEETGEQGGDDRERHGRQLPELRGPVARLQRGKVDVGVNPGAK